MITQATVRSNKQDIFVNENGTYVDGFVTKTWEYDPDRARTVMISFRSDWYQEFELALTPLFYKCWLYVIDIRDYEDTLEIDLQINGHKTSTYRDPITTWQYLYADQTSREQVDDMWNVIASKVELTELHAITD